MRLPYVVLWAGVALAASHGIAGRGGYARGVLSSDLVNATTPKVALGDTICMRWTGARCDAAGCNTSHSGVCQPCRCEQGYCTCPPGHCADAHGECVDGGHGKHLGTHTIRFVKPHRATDPYVSSVASGIMKRDTLQLIEASAEASDWNLVLSPGGHVRLESAASPGHVLAIWANRRRSSSHFLQDATRQDESSGEAMDPEAFKAVLMPLEQVRPIDATFRVRETMNDGGGIEIFYPQHLVALASETGDRGVGYCDAHPIAGHCEGRQLVRFQPPLPKEAVFTVTEEAISELSTLYYHHPTIALLLLLFCVLVFGLFFGCVGWCCYKQASLK